VAVSVGTISAQLVADARRFQREMRQSTEQLSLFRRGADLAKRALGGLEQAGRVALGMFTALVGGIALAVRETAAYADEIDKLSVRTGIATGDLQELHFAFKILGADARILERATISMSSSLLDASGRATQVARQMEGLGAELFRSDGTFRESAALFQEIVGVLSSMEDETERNALASRVFGRGVARELIPVLAAGGDAVARLRNEFRESGRVMSEDTIRAGVALTDQIERMSSAFKAGRMSISAEFLPVATLFAEWAERGALLLNNLSQEQRDSIVRFVSLAAVVLGAVGSFAALGVAVRAAAFVFGPFVTIVRVVFGIFGLLGAGIMAVLGVFRVFAAFILRNVAVILSRVLGRGLLALLGPVGLVIAAVWTLYEAWKNNWFGIRDVLTGVWDQHIKPIFEAIVSWLDDRFPGPMNALRESWSSAWGAISGAVETAKDVVLPILREIADVVETVLKFGIAVAETAWVIAWSAMQARVQEMWSVVGPIITNVGAFIREHMEKPIEAVKSAWEVAWNAIRNVTGTAWDGIKIMFQAMKDFIAMDLEDRIKLFETTWERAWTGITDSVRTAWGVIKDIFESIKAFFRAPLSLDIQMPGAGVLQGLAGAAARVSPFAALGALGQRILRRQNGGILPGFGGGDRIPVLAEAGEAIVPARVVREGLGAVLGWFRAHGIGGPVRRMQEGGVIGRALQSLRGMVMPSVPRLEDLFEVETAKELATMWDDLLVATRFRIREEEKAAEAAQALGDDLPELRNRWRDFTDWVGSQWREITDRIRENVVPAREQLQQFAVGLIGAFHPLNLLGNLLGRLAGPVNALLMPLAMVADILMRALMPVFRALFPVVKGFAQLLLFVARVVGTVWNALLDLISLIPFVNLRAYKVDLEALSEGSRELAALTWEQAAAQAGLTDETQKAMDAMRGVPTIWRVVSRRVQAAIAPPPGVVQSFGSSNPSPVPVNSSVSVQVVMNGDSFGVEDLDERVRTAAAQGVRSASLAQHGLVGAV
jgi:phage-related protein